MLAARGITADIADNGRVAVARLEQASYALVFMDIQMPELDGYAATAAIRAAEAAAGGPRRPIVAMTAHAMAGDRERCLAAGMDDYLSKPLRPAELDAVLDRWLGTGSAPELEPEPGDASEALLDEARMRIFRDDYADIAGKLADLFATSTPELIDELLAAEAQGDAKALRSAAHKLKGSCQNVGAAFMATLASSLERGDAPAGTVAELAAAFPATRDALHDALGTGA
jgi:CheY-like chemotaxis protein/HPt (histidine-containing phosphotransfer) domain-containing protein